MALVRAVMNKVVAQIDAHNNSCGFNVTKYTVFIYLFIY